MPIGFLESGLSKRRPLERIKVENSILQSEKGKNSEKIRTLSRLSEDMV